MIYEKNSFERYKEGKALSEKYTPQNILGMVAMFLWGALGLTLEVNFNIGLLFCLSFVCVPFWPAMKAAMLATKGDMMMKSAHDTYGSDEEEY